MARILILGGGFAGLVTAEQLSKAFAGEAADHRITLVAPNRQFTFYPALVRLAFGGCESGDISFDLAERLQSLSVDFIEGEAVEIKADLKRVRVTGKNVSGDISYDYLVLAMGRRLATEKVPGFFEHAHHLLDAKAAVDFGEAVKSIERGNIVVGLSPQAFLPVPACEAAFALARKFKEKIESREISVTIVFPETLSAAFAGADLHYQLESAFEKHHVKVVTGFAVREVANREIISTETEKLSYDLLLLVPPFRGQAMLERLGITDDLDFVVADEYMRVPYLGGVYAAGDIVAFTGPKLAHMAVRQARIAADNMVSEINGEEPKEAYYHEIATIIDEGGAESLYLHYGIWDEMPYNLKKGRFWSWTKEIHDGLWQSFHS